MGTHGGRGIIMLSVKVLPKGQITLPKQIRTDLHINIGDTLVLEEKAKKVILRKGKTIFDYAGTLPNPGMSIDEMREKAIGAEAEDNV